MAVNEIQYSHYGRCCVISNGKVEVYVTLDVGPRIIRYGFAGGENMLGELSPDAVEKTVLGDWHPWGGHRLWHAPEVKPRTYSPDDDPVQSETLSDYSVRFIQKVEPATSIAKEMTVELSATDSRVTITHKLTNKGLWAVELAPWAVTIMNGGGTTILPHEPFVPHGESLLPARPMVLWTYTDLSDPRWKFGKKYVLLRTDEKLDFAQKLGATDKQEWAAYLRNNTLFIKRFPYIDGAAYPDYGCNFETYTKGDFMEVETLGPFAKLQPEESVTHVENWFLFNIVEAGEDEDSLDATLTPLVARTSL